MEDYAHRSYTPLSEAPASSGAPASSHRRVIGFRYLIPAGMLLGFLFFLISVAVKAALGPTAVPSPLTQEATPTAAQVAVFSPTREETKPPDRTPSPTSTTAVTDVSMLVLNGSGEAGVAGKMRQELTALGYSGIRTNNADNYDYTNITVQATTAHRAEAEAVRKQLAKTHTVGSVQSVASAAADVVVIVGKED